MIFSIVCQLLSPIRLIRRSRCLERLLDLQRVDSGLAGINEVCAYDGRKLGDYYYWKIINTLVLLWMKILNVRDIRRFVAAHEVEVSVFPKLEPGCGVVFAIPHYGHFVMSIISLAMKLPNDLDVYIFYESPAKHASNVLFDLLHKKIFAAKNSNIHVIYNDRRGLATALNALKCGSVLIILPDVYNDVRDTFVLPFLGRQQHVMLGTAALVRRTNAVLYPVISQPLRDMYRFRTTIGSSLNISSAPLPLRESINQYLEYELTFRMFRWFERFMESGIMFWQYAGVLLSKKDPFICWSAAMVAKHEALLLGDPRIRITTAGAIRLPCSRRET